METNTVSMNTIIWNIDRHQKHLNVQNFIDGPLATCAPSASNKVCWFVLPFFPKPFRGAVEEQIPLALPCG